MLIRIKKLHEHAHLPEYAHGPLEDAGMDIRCIDGVIAGTGHSASGSQPAWLWKFLPVTKCKFVHEAASR